MYIYTSCYKQYIYIYTVLKNCIYIYMYLQQYTLYIYVFYYIIVYYIIFYLYSTLNVYIYIYYTHIFNIFYIQYKNIPMYVYVYIYMFFAKQGYPQIIQNQTILELKPVFWGSSILGNLNFFKAFRERGRHMRSTRWCSSSLVGE